MNKKCEINIDKFDNDLVNPSEKDLLKKMLALQPEKRYTAKQCLDHPMLSTSSSSTTEANEDIYQVESELEVSDQQNNIAQYIHIYIHIYRFMRKRMKCFPKNPFIKL